MMSTPETQSPAQGDDRQVVTNASMLRVALGASIAAALLVWSFLGAFSSPAPDGLAVRVVGPEQVVGQLATGLDSAAPGAFDISATSDAAAARDALTDGEIAGAVVVTQDGATIYTASAGGLADARAIDAAFTKALGQAGIPVTTQDARPLPASDSQGVSIFFLVLATTIPAVIFAIAGAFSSPTAEMRPRAVALGTFAIVVGVINNTVAHMIALDGSWWATSGLVALIVVAVGGAAIILQRLLGRLAGSAAALALFVIYGLPATGGPIGVGFTPVLFHGVGSWMPSTVGLEAIRRSVYFGGAGAQAPVLALVGWASVVILIGGLLATSDRLRNPAPGVGSDPSSYLTTK